MPIESVRRSFRYDHALFTDPCVRDETAHYHVKVFAVRSAQSLRGVVPKVLVSVEVVGFIYASGLLE